MRLVGLAMILVGVALPAPAVTTYANEFFAVDQCLDGGGSYDYSRGVCDATRNHPYVPFFSRHPQLARTAVPLGAVGLVLIIIGALVFRRSSRRVA
jgi:hypothetical protein